MFSVGVMVMIRVRVRVTVMVGIRFRFRVMIMVSIRVKRINGWGGEIERRAKEIRGSQACNRSLCLGPKAKR